MNAIEKTECAELVNDLIPHLMITKTSDSDIKRILLFVKKIRWEIRPAFYYTLKFQPKKCPLITVTLYSWDEVRNFLKGMLAHGVDLSKQLSNYEEYVKEG